MSFEFALRNYSSEDLPTNEAVIAAARNLVEQVRTSWPEGKEYTGKYNVKTFKDHRDGRLWVARLSQHPDLSFELFKKGLLEQHAESDLHYIPMLDNYKEVEEYKCWQKTINHYKFPTFFRDREFVVWVLTHQPDPDVEEFFVISLPTTALSDSGIVRGEYCSIEQVTRVNGVTEWLGVMTSDAKGSIPLWLQNLFIVGSFVTDVPNYIEYAKAKWPGV